MKAANMHKSHATLTTIIFCVMVVSLYAPSASSQAPEREAQEQSEFGGDAELNHALPVPGTARDIIRRAMDRTVDELPDNHFRASEIHLDGLAEVDLIVLVYVSSHGARFFMLQPFSDGFKIILDSGGDFLKVLQTKSKGYRNIQIETFSQAARFTTYASYRFNGRRYVKVSEKTQNTK